MYIKIKRKPRAKHLSMKFHGDKLNFKDFLQISKIVFGNRAPSAFYRFSLPYVSIILSCGVGLGYLLSLL
tara:strand:- start:210 stop:419 length:210 start_codon:yes stop_codon:yes gene_type:complete